MSDIIMSLYLVLGLGIIAVVLGWNVYDWAVRYINETELERKRKPAGWGWLHLKANKYLGLEFSDYPMPAPLVYVLTILIVLVSSLLWFIALPVMAVMGVLTYLRYEKRKEKLTS